MVVLEDWLAAGARHANGIRIMSAQDINDANLLVVIAVDGYARRHHISAADAYGYLSDKAIPRVIRENYATLHMLDPFEVVDFVEDVLKRENVR